MSRVYVALDELLAPLTEKTERRCLPSSDLTIGVEDSAAFGPHTRFAK
jgi:hypothetical protein